MPALFETGRNRPDIDLRSRQVMSAVELQAEGRVIQSLSTEATTQRIKTKQQLFKQRQSQRTLCDLRKQMQQVNQVPPPPTAR